MPDQTILDLARSDAVAGRCDDVIFAADEIDIAIVVDAALVSGGHPVSDEFVSRRRRTLPVLQKHHRIRPLHRDLSDFVDGGARAVLPDHLDLMAGYRLPDRAGPRHAEEGTGREHKVALGLPVELVDANAQRGLAPFQRLGAK